MSRRGAVTTVCSDSPKDKTIFHPIVYTIDHTDMMKAKCIGSNYGDYKYSLGMNISDTPGMYYCELQYVLNYLYYGTTIAIVEPVATVETVADGVYRTQRLNVLEMRSVLDINTLEWLEQQGVDVRTDDDALFVAAAYEMRVDLMTWLLARGADLHTYRDLAIRRAAERGNLKVVQYLYEHGANIHAMEDYAIRWAVINGHLEVVQYLCQQGANLDIHKDDVLKWAALNGYPNMVRYLMDRGAVNQEAEQWARSNHRWDVVAVFQDKSSSIA
jgi:hypothetical protein